MKDIIVSLDGSGNYTSIQLAIDAASQYKDETVRILIKNGTYKEKLFIEQSNIELIGESKDKTIITYNDYGKKEFGEELMGTFRSYTVFIGGDHFKAENITFENSAGPGTIVGQAIAVYANGDQAVFNNCKFLGSQDTLFTGPLPLKEIIPGGFKGPGEHLERKPTCQLYSNCYIKGDIDFIFGSSKTVFYKCVIEAIDRNMKENAYITAPSTPANQDYGYVFIECDLISDAKEETVYLGRPWRNEGKVAYINCWMDKHIHREGWHNWNKVEAEATVEFVEYNSKGPGAKLESRAKWAKVLSEVEARKYSIEKILPNEMIKGLSESM
ncbi:pectinesterase [Natranaerovirga pectinivora]|uniref:Pectinesterase n=1 Tax=Natranaerovirga pectinivora TaxID=682400 RepID=A0A4R3MKC9_9FIRM|nr:pectinesterase family protein [Natranaerovirga pectinivora]TCT14883.1 pectinesterase [Natranaerovirga pectinivora]